MKKIYIIHRWDGKPESDWYSWLKKELERKYNKKDRDSRIEVRILKMPNTEEPVIREWVDYLKKAVPSPDKNTYFVGHSIGCQAIMRYLETFDNVKISGALFVAGWFYLENLEDEEVKKIAAPWLKDSINLEKVRKSIGDLRVILSNNDPYDCVGKNKERFEQKLNATVLIEKDGGHFTEAECPVILNNFL